jgi:GNAT superfamily N-acetyltransferase
MAPMREDENATAEYWEARIASYIDLQLYPQKALEPRAIFVAEVDKVVGFAAGHLTTRYDCDGELQWINVLPNYQKQGISAKLLKELTKWFVKREAFKVCVNADPENHIAQQFYKKHGAVNINPHWLIWNDITIMLDQNEKDAAK